MRQSTRLDKIYNNLQINTDYTTPVWKAGTLEMGYQLTVNKENETYQSDAILPLPESVTNEKSQFEGVIQAGYTTWQFQIGHLNVKTGLRAENLNRELKMADNKYPLRRFDLYPTFNSSFKINSIHEILINYTRRTDQLRTIELDPLPRWYDFFNVMVGNPNLKNEITDKIALNYLVNLRNLTLSNELYFYKTSDKIEVIRTIYHDAIIQNRYENTGNEKSCRIKL